jgi:chemotaxis protein MotA
MDIATFLGIIFGIVCIIYTIIAGASPLAFFDLRSVLIVLGGGIGSTLISYRAGEILKILNVVKHAFCGKQFSHSSLIRMLVELSQKARREGLLSLESEQEQIEDNFIKQSLQLIVDGVEPDTIRESLGLELENLKIRHNRGQSLFRTMGALFPAWGMIGTLMGLISLLKNLHEPSTIGPSMALALVTTFYGSVLSNFICIPIANKLKIKSQEEIQQKEMIIEGILSIQAGENPRIMEHKLKTFLSPSQKQQYDKESEDEKNTLENAEQQTVSN